MLWAGLKTIGVVALVGVLVVGLTPAAVSDYWQSPAAEEIDSKLERYGDEAEAALANVTGQDSSTGGSGDPAQGTNAPTATGTPTATATGQADASAAVDRSRVERLVHQEINERRAANGLSELGYDTRLRDIARSHSEDMAARDYFAHVSPDGADFEDRYRQFGYDCRVETGDLVYAGGENILYTYYRTSISKDGRTVYYDTPADLATGIVNSWMNSSGHRKNILEPFWRAEGIGIATTDSPYGTKVYATQNFC